MEGVVRYRSMFWWAPSPWRVWEPSSCFFRFLPSYGPWNALKWGVFHSVSAFCNAGFDILGVLKPGSSLMLFQKDPVVCLTIMALIVVGGLGFFCLGGSAPGGAYP